MAAVIQADWLRDAALERVSRGTFTDDVCAALSDYRGQYLTGEAIRFHMEQRGIEPHHHNAWGAAIMTAARRGLLEKTGRYLPMQSLKSHARRTPEYRVL